MCFQAIHSCNSQELLKSTVTIDPSCLTATCEVIETTGIHHFELDTVRRTGVGNDDLLTGQSLSKSFFLNLNAAFIP